MFNQRSVGERGGTRRSFHDLRPDLPTDSGASHKNNEQVFTPGPPEALPPAFMQWRLGKSRFRPGDRVATGAAVELGSNREDRVFITAGFEGNPSPVAIDSVWSDCAVCDVHLGEQLRPRGTVRGVNHADDAKWDTASLLFDGLSHGVALPLSTLKNLGGRAFLNPDLTFDAAQVTTVELWLDDRVNPNRRHR